MAVQDERWYHFDQDEAANRWDDGDSLLERSVIPGVCSEGGGWIVEPVDAEGADHIWRVLAPGEPELTDEEEATERAARSQAPKRAALILSSGAPGRSEPASTQRLGGRA